MACQKFYYRNPRVIMTQVLDCDTQVSESELQSRTYVHIRINTFGMNSFIPPSRG